LSNDWSPNYTTLLQSFTPDSVYIDPAWDQGRIADVLIGYVDTAFRNKVQCLLEANTARRLSLAYEVVVSERRHAQWTLELQERSIMAIKDQHRELFLREQLRAILEELGESVQITLHNPVFRGRGFKTAPDLAFVLMPFDEKFRAVFDNIVKPVVERFQLRCV